MSNPRDNNAPETITSAPLAPDVETRSTVPPVGTEAAAIVKRMKREDILKKLSLSLRWSSFVFSLIAFVVMVSNRHGEEINFEDYEEYSYVLAIAIISSVYTAYQGIREVIQFVTRKYTSPHLAFAIIDFVADQVLAYLLISAASAAVPLTNRARKVYEGYSNVMTFLDMAAASISMTFLAFFTLALSLLISGYKLSAHFFR
ncbi:CASP-like protein 4B1 [Benincasa hispida]|uniref:CASP-like protein 4B1 n=1 Tax=Benincasa hispida TaxID=102211 RepID=UPI0018FFAA57|nr:CASP-like protein 4B1 [Benincasa hispida]